jgi:ferritin
VKFFNVTKTTDNTMNFLKNVDGLYDFYTEQDKTFDGSIKALKNVTRIGKNSKVFSIFDKYGTKTVKTIEDVVGLIGG